MLTNEMAARKNLVQNLRYIMRKEQIETQKELAERLTVAPATLTNVMNEKLTPTIYPFFQSLHNLYGYSVEEMLQTVIEEEAPHMGAHEEISEAGYRKFVGVYQMTAFDTSAFKGRDYKTARDALDFGVLVIYKDKSKGLYRCLAQLALSKESCTEHYKAVAKLFAKPDMPEQCLQYLRSVQTHHTYHGDLSLTMQHVYLSLHYSTKDRMHIVLHRPDSASNRYIGGIGGMVAISKGRNASPCIQLVGICKFPIDVAEEEIARKLMLSYPSITLGEEMKKLIALIRSQYEQAPHVNGALDGDLGLSQTHKEYLLRGEITKIIRDVVEKNLFRGLTVSYADDDDWYHYIKQFDPAKR